MLFLAIRDRASDIHFEPFEDEFKIRYRVRRRALRDGAAAAAPGVRRHQPHQGHGQPRHRRDARCRRTAASSSSVGGHPVDLRVSVLPTMFGETCVMRVLDRSRGHARPRRRSACARTMLDAFRGCIAQPNGIVLVTGPDRLGQDDHALRGLNELNDVDDKIITTEDPVEYDIDGIDPDPDRRGDRRHVRQLPARRSCGRTRT